MHSSALLGINEACKPLSKNPKFSRSIIDIPLAFLIFLVINMISKLKIH